MAKKKKTNAKKQVSPKTANTVKKLTNKFTGKNTNIAADKKPTAEKQTQQEDNKAKAVKEDKKADKIKPLEQGNELVDMLMKIYNFIQKSYDDDKSEKEKRNNFKESNALSAEKRHKELLDAIKGMKSGGESGTATKDDESEDGGGFGLGDALGAARFARSSGAILARVGALLVGGGVATAAAVAAALGIPVMMLMNRQDEAGAKQTSEGIIGVTGGTSDAQAITDVVANTDARERKKQNLLADRPWSKKSLAFWKDPEMQAKYLEQVGWDDKTGTTQAERDAGFIAIDENGKLLKAPSPTTEPKSETPASTSAPASAENSPSTGTPTASPSTEAAVPAPTTPTSAALNSAVAENNNSKLEESTSEPESTVINNTTTTQMAESQPYVRTKMPAVRNQEETFQRMIVYSTRVV